MLLRILCCLLLFEIVSASPAVDETRGLWVIRTSLCSPESVEQVVTEAAGSGFNTLFVQVRGRGDALYRSRLEPRSELLKKQPRDFDPLAEVTASAGKKRLKVHVWLNTLLVHSGGGIPGGRHVLARQPQWAMVPRQLANSLYARNAASPATLKKIQKEIRGHEKGIEGLYLDPAEPGVRRRILDICLELATTYQIDAIHLDYIRYPSPEFGFGRTALDRFAAEIDRDLPAARRTRLRKAFVRDRLIYTKTFPGRWDGFRREQVTQLVREVREGLKSRRPDLLLTAAVSGDSEMARALRFQDWRKWTEKGLLDAICPMVYVSEAETFKDQVALARGYSFGTKVWVGIGAWQLPVAQTIEKIELTRRVGTDGFVLFAYGALSNESAQAAAQPVPTALRSFLLQDSVTLGSK
jgi:uncharacterized lipoprotein YddW (UPF0748 family)